VNFQSKGIQNEVKTSNLNRCTMSARNQQITIPNFKSQVKSRNCTHLRVTTPKWMPC